MRAALRETIETVALAIFLVLLFQATIQNYRVEGPSMLPRLESFDRVLVNKVAFSSIDVARASRWVPGWEGQEGKNWYPFGEPSYGDIVVFKWPRDERQNFVKRIIGVPGDTIRIEAGVVYRNGAIIDEPYVEQDSRETLAERLIAEGAYYVLGDNRAQSDDSRHWGSVPEENIIGQVWLAYWPMGSFTTLFPRAHSAFR